MTQVTKFVIGFDEAVTGNNDSLEEAINFIRSAGIGKEMVVKVIIFDKDEN